jgi:hypothetical protein
MLVVTIGYINRQLSRTEHLGCTLPAQVRCIYSFLIDYVTAYVLAVTNLVRQNIKSNN